MRRRKRELPRKADEPRYVMCRGCGGAGTVYADVCQKCMGWGKVLNPKAIL